MRIAAQKVNNIGIQVSKAKVADVTKKYTLIYSQMCERLADLGYISSSTLFYADEFWEVFFDENPNLVNLFINNRVGSVVLNEKQIEFVMRKLEVENNTDLEAYKVLSYAKSLLQAKTALDDLCKFVSAVKFPKKSDLLTCKTNISVSSKVSSSGKIPLDSPYIMECFYVPDGKKVVDFDYAIIILKVLLEKLGINSDVSETDDSLFLGKGFTIKDDCYFLNEIINGDISGNGIYANMLTKVVENYYVDYYATRTTIADCISFGEQNFIYAIPKCIEYINEYRKEIGNTGTEFYVTSSKVYFLFDGVVEKPKPSVRNIFIGTELYNHGTKTEINVLNRLLGFSGEFIYEYDSNVVNYSLGGFPVTMYQISVNRGRNVAVPLNFYPIVNAKQKYKNELVEVYPSVKHECVKFISVDDMLKELEIDSLETLHTEVADIVETRYTVNTYSFKKLVGLMIQTLVCIMCNYTLEGHESPNHLILGSEFDWVTEEIYLDACIEAEILFNKLGF